MAPIRKKLIEVALPLEAINEASAKEKSIRHGHPSTLHLWWARRPLAACRAVLFGQLVDDPSAWPEHFPTVEAQDQERQRLFGLITDLVQWENSNKEPVINAVRAEIARSLARGRKAEGTAEAPDEAVLRVPPSYGADGRYREQDKSDVAVVNRYLAEVAPPVHDPFAGGGSIPLEAQRLGLRAIATDLNPVPVLINKALIVIPPKFAGVQPVNPDARCNSGLRTWKGATGLAEDTRYYGKWIRDEAFKRIGHLYPEVELPKEDGGGKATVVAWLWARTVASPNPACGGAHVPLLSSFWLLKKPGKDAWVEVAVDRAAGTWRFEARTGKPADRKAVDAGTKTGRGDFRCVLSGDAVPAEYVRREGQAGRIRDRLMAIVAEGKRGRVYVSPRDEHEKLARVPVPDGAPDTDLPEQALGFRIQNYGMRKHRDLFTPRQLTALVTFRDLVGEARVQVLADASRAGMVAGEGLEAGGTGARAYAEAVGVYLALGVGKATSRNCSLAVWEVGMGRLAGALGRQALSMVVGFAETNPMAGAGGDIAGTIGSTCEVLDLLFDGVPGVAVQSDAVAGIPGAQGRAVLSFDPPYFDNVAYADLSDFFYVWLRPQLKDVFPSFMSTMLVPKNTELVAEPFRHGGRGQAEAFFMKGMQSVLGHVAQSANGQPVTIYYAFKQAESDKEAVSSTGWETFLHSVCQSGLSVDGTWPLRTEQSSGLIYYSREPSSRATNLMPLLGVAA